MQLSGLLAAYQAIRTMWLLGHCSLSGYQDDVVIRTLQLSGYQDGVVIRTLQLIRTMWLLGHCSLSGYQDDVTLQLIRLSGWSGHCKNQALRTIRLSGRWYYTAAIRLNSLIEVSCWLQDNVALIIKLSGHLLSQQDTCCSYQDTTSIRTLLQLSGHLLSQQDKFCSYQDNAYIAASATIRSHCSYQDTADAAIRTLAVTRTHCSYRNRSSLNNKEVISSKKQQLPPHDWRIAAGLN